MLTKSLKDTCKTYVDFVFNTPANIHVLRVNNRSTRPRYGIYSKLTIKTPERRYWCRFSVFIVNYGHILHLVFLLLTVNMLLPAGYCVLVRLCISSLQFHGFLGFVTMRNKTASSIYYQNSNSFDVLGYINFFTFIGITRGKCVNNYLGE